MEALDLFAYFACPYLMYELMRRNSTFGAIIAGLLWGAYFVRMRSAQWAEKDLRDAQWKLDRLQEEYSKLKDEYEEHSKN